MPRSGGGRIVTSRQDNPPARQPSRRGRPTSPGTSGSRDAGRTMCPLRGGGTCAVDPTCWCSSDSRRSCSACWPCTSSRATTTTAAAAAADVRRGARRDRGPRRPAPGRRGRRRRPGTEVERVDRADRQPDALDRGSQLIGHRADADFAEGEQIRVRRPAQPRRWRPGPDPRGLRGRGRRHRLRRRRGEHDHPRRPGERLPRRARRVAGVGDDRRAARPSPSRRPRRGRELLLTNVLVLDVPAGHARRSR